MTKIIKYRGVKTFTLLVGWWLVEVRINPSTILFNSCKVTFNPCEVRYNSHEVTIPYKVRFPSKMANNKFRGAKFLLQVSILNGRAIIAILVKLMFFRVWWR